MKQKIHDDLIVQIMSEIQALDSALKSAHAAATHEESRQEDKHDTRGIEASYLAAGTAKRLDDLRSTLDVLRGFRLQNFGPRDAIGIGALIELDRESAHAWYFLLPAGGGYKVAISEKIVSIITARSPLGEALLGKHVGDEVEAGGKSLQVYAVRAVL